MKLDFEYNIKEILLISLLVVRGPRTLTEFDLRAFRLRSNSVFDRYKTNFLPGFEWEKFKTKLQRNVLRKNYFRPAATVSKVFPEHNPLQKSNKEEADNKSIYWQI